MSDQTIPAAQRKAISYIVRQACDLYAATMGDESIWENRAHMREAIGQRVDAELPLLTGGYLAEYVIAANAGRTDA